MGTKGNIWRVKKSVCSSGAYHIKSRKKRFIHYEKYVSSSLQRPPLVGHLRGRESRPGGRVMRGVGPAGHALCMRHAPRIYIGNRNETVTGISHGLPDIADDKQSWGQLCVRIQRRNSLVTTLDLRPHYEEKTAIEKWKIELKNIYICNQFDIDTHQYVYRISSWCRVNIYVYLNIILASIYYINCKPFNVAVVH